MQEPIYCGDSRNKSNYTVTKTDAVLTVAVTVVATDKSKVYGDINPTLTATAVL
jgi:hypothetical protein